MNDQPRNLFGDVIVTVNDGPYLGPKKSPRKPTPRKGYAWKPGTGPAGETCQSCAHLVRKRMGKVYLKCALTRHAWTSGQGSDVLAKSPACKFWQQPTEE